MPTFRLFSHQTSGLLSTMFVNLLWSDAIGLPHVTPVGTIGGVGSWTPTLQLQLSNSLPLWMPGSTLAVRLQFTTVGIGDTWQIDDVYLDPYSR
jgi:hypothetical protein